MNTVSVFENGEWSEVDPSEVAVYRCEECSTGGETDLGEGDVYHLAEQ